jgi:hypothetical protein
MNKKVVRMDDQGNVLGTYDSAVHAEQAADLIGIRGLHKTNITQCCKGKRPTAGGYRWKYASDNAQ